MFKYSVSNYFEVIRNVKLEVARTEDSQQYEKKNYDVKWTGS